MLLVTLYFVLTTALLYGVIRLAVRHALEDDHRRRQAEEALAAIRE